jgi:HEPN domain-containing protein
VANPEAAALLRIAWRDLRAAERLQDPAIDEASWGFFVQQAVEKALKAWLLLMAESPPPIHNLTVLFRRIADRQGAVDPFLSLEAFTDFAVQFRYDDQLEPMGLDRLAWQQRATALVRHVDALMHDNG